MVIKFFVSMGFTRDVNKKYVSCYIKTTVQTKDNGARQITFLYKNNEKPRLVWLLFYFIFKEPRAEPCEAFWGQRYFFFKKLDRTDAK